MSRNRRRRDSNAPRPELARTQQSRKPQPSSSLAGTGIPEWRWRTTPVVFMFALGGLIGAYLGLAAAVADNFWAFLIVQGGFALILGAALGRVVRRRMAIRRVERIRAS
jgi:hypothetical protein